MNGRASGLRLGLRLEACAIAVLARAAVRCLPLPRAVRLLGAIPARRRAGDPTDACLAAASDAAERMAHPTCLYRALIAFALLTRRRRDAGFHLGASRQQGFSAHAWVSAGGIRLDMPGGGEYVPLWGSGTPDARG